MVALAQRFNPRPRTGGDPSSALVFMLPQCFNPRPRTGGDLCSHQALQTKR